MAIRLASRGRLPGARLPARTTRPSALFRPSTSETALVPWASAGSLTGVTIDSTTVGGSFDRLDVEVLFTETTGTLARAYLQYRPAGSGTVGRQTIDLDQARPAGQTAGAYGIMLDLNVGASYDILLTAIDNLGNVQTVLTTGTTWTETNDPYTALTPTRFVRADGSDSNLGTSDTSGGAWLTVEKAFNDAPNNAVVQVGPGTFEVGVETQLGLCARRSSTSETISFIAQNPCLTPTLTGDYLPTEANVGSQTWLISARRTSPTGSGDTNAGVWTQVVLTGPGRKGCTPGTEYTVWKFASGWTTSVPIDLMQIGATKLGEARQIGVWVNIAGDVDDGPSWIERVMVNDEYRYGAFWDPDNGDIFCRLPGDVDPNTVWISFGYAGQCFITNAPNCRYVGLRFKGVSFPISTNGNSSGGLIVERCIFENAIDAVHTRGTTTTTLSTAGNHVVQDCWFKDYGVRAPDGGATDGTWPTWNFVKSTVSNPDGTRSPASGQPHFGHNLESSAISGRRVQHHITMRRCLIDGLQNGFGHGTSDTTGVQSRYQGYGWHIAKSTFRNLQDDAFEFDSCSANNLVIDCRVEHALSFVSISPHHYGPAMVVRSVGWEINNLGLEKRASDGLTVTNGTASVKYGSTSNPTARLYLIHCTVWTGSQYVYNNIGQAGGPGALAGVSANDEIFTVINSILRCAGNYAAAWGNKAGQWEDHNLIATAQADRGVRPTATGTNYLTPVGSYRTAMAGSARADLSGTSSVHTNVVSGADQVFNAATWLDALLTDPENGDVTMTSAALTATTGHSVKGISDHLGRIARIGYQP